jgi:tyrosinase
MANALVRQNIWTLNSEDEWNPIILAYARAVGELKQRGDTDTGSWSYQTAVHWLDGTPLSDKFRNQCQHMSWFFLAWHRMYLYHFEELIRSVIANDPQVSDEVKSSWALPYWDYTKDEASRMLPPAFAAQKLPGGQDNPLFDDSRNVALNNRTGRLTENAVKITEALKPVRFVTHGLDAGFAGPKTKWHHYLPPGAMGPVEGTPHGSVHNMVGGNMSSLDTAPRDPIFWLHHCNIDRLWEVWLGLGGGRANTNDPDWLNNQEFYFHDPEGNPVKHTVAGVLNTATQLNYSYEDISGPPGPLAAGPMKPEPKHPAQLVGATPEPVPLTGESASVSIPLEEPSGPLSAGEPPSRVYLTLDDITSTQAPAVPYSVYLNTPANTSGDKPSGDYDHYVGTTSTFGIEQLQNPDSPHAEGMNVVFDITDLYERLNEAGLWQPDHVSVQFVPQYVEPVPGPLSPGPRVPGSEPQPGAISVGRVGVHFQ